MSRSFRKPIIKDGGRKARNIADRKIRGISVYDDRLISGSIYKRFVCQYDICDWWSRYNPYPIYWFNRNGEMIEIPPDPIYKYNRK